MTTYQITSHEYTEIIPCADPTNCHIARHWDVDADDVPADEVEVWITVNDHPATRVTEQPQD